MVLWELENNRANKEIIKLTGTSERSLQETGRETDEEGNSMKHGKRRRMQGEKANSEPANRMTIDSNYIFPPCNYELLLFAPLLCKIFVTLWSSPLLHHQTASPPPDFKQPFMVKLKQQTAMNCRGFPEPQEMMSHKTRSHCLITEECASKAKHPKRRMERK